MFLVPKNLPYVSHNKQALRKKIVNKFLTLNREELHQKKELLPHIILKKIISVICI